PALRVDCANLAALLDALTQRARELVAPVLPLAAQVDRDLGPPVSALPLEHLGEGRGELEVLDAITEMAHQLVEGFARVGVDPVPERGLHEREHRSQRRLLGGDGAIPHAGARARARGARVVGGAPFRY